MFSLCVAFIIYLNWATSAVAAAATPTTQTTQAQENQIDAFSKGFYEFGIDLYQQCVQSERGKNVIISPFSVATALTLLLQATNGKTYAQLKNRLHLQDNNITKSHVADQFRNYMALIKKSAGQSELMIVNQIYVQQTCRLNKEFQEIAANQFDAGVESVNFLNTNETTQLINNFVRTKTMGKIEKFVPPGMIGALTRVFLANAVYLKSAWVQPFPLPRVINGVKLERTKLFYISETETIHVNFMAMKTRFWVVGVPDLDISALRLDYLNSNLSFIIVLPNKRIGLSTLENQLQNMNLSTIVGRMSFQQYIVEIPKFKVTTKLHLNDVLKKMGINEIFDPNLADLSGLLSDAEPLFVSDVIHEATIEISETFTEASAATGINLKAQSGSPSFTADHPFMYYVLDRETNTTIFSGCIKNIPTDNQL